VTTAVPMTNGIIGAYDFGVQDELYLACFAYVFDLSI
jgi:hypothetical protein